MPSPANPPAACRFHTRCPCATEICSEVEPQLVDYGNGHWAACHHPRRPRAPRGDRRGRPRRPLEMGIRSAHERGIAALFAAHRRTGSSDMRLSRFFVATSADRERSRLGVAACGDDDGGDSGGRARHADPRDHRPAGLLDPAGSYDLPSYDVIYNVYQNLLQFPPGGNKPSRRRPRSATSPTEHAGLRVHAARTGSSSPTARPRPPRTSSSRSSATSRSPIRTAPPRCSRT